MENGTHGRKWYTNQKGNIAFSIIIKCECNIDKLEGITTDVAEVIVKILKSRYNIKLQIKAPNDIVFDNKKLGGILTELKSCNGFAEYMVIGIGLNLNQEKFIKEIQKKATSIKKEFGIDVNREEIITDFCEVFEQIVIKRLVFD